MSSNSVFGVSSNVKIPTFISRLTNRAEDKDFFRTALAWQGSVTPRVMARVAVCAFYAFGVSKLFILFPHLSMPVTPFEYSGAVLGLLLVLRVNSGGDRWWEARKIWGSIVNQSRNLAIIGTEYRNKKDNATKEFLKWVAAWPHVMRESLRNENGLLEVTRILGTQEANQIRTAVSMPTYVGARIAQLLKALREDGLDDFAFLRAERERALLIDAIGACERIRNTPIPLVLAIKIRRFILIFLILLPMCLVDRAGMLTPLVVSLAAYPLFSLDEIGAELQNPFSKTSLSHLPLDTICMTIETNVSSLGPN